MAWWNPLTWGKKSLDTSNDSTTTDQTFRDFILGEQSLKSSKIDPTNAYNFYESVAALSDSVRKISSKAKIIDYGIKRDNDEIDYNHDIIRLIKNPGEGSTGSLFSDELFKSSLLTSEAWVVARGNVKRPPLALVAVRPYDVYVTVSSVDGMIKTIHTTGYNDRRTYTRFETPQGVRYFSRDMLSEIIPIFSEKRGNEDCRGLSRLGSIKQDLEQLRSGKQHNLSLLKNGAKPSIIGMPQGERTFNENQVRLISNYFKAQQQGADNAGNIWIQSVPMKLESFGLSNTDMDYKNLQSAAEYSVRNTYNIPLSLVSAETMTMDNYKIAITSLYTEAVFPEWRSLIPQLVEALSVRWKDLEGVTAAFDPLSIDALREKHIDQMKQLRETRSVSLNEIRKAGGFDDVPGGEAILIQANELPFMAVEGPPDLTEGQDMTEESEDGED